MNFNVDIEKFKKEIAYNELNDLRSNDLLALLKHNVDYLKHHNKNTTKTQDNAIDVLYVFINSLSGTDEHTVNIGKKVRVIRVSEDDLLREVHVGDVGYVIDYDPVDDTVLVRFDNGFEWWFYPNQITEEE